MFCPRCGSNLPDNAAFCNACGTQIVATAPTTTSPNAAAPVTAAPTTAAPVAAQQAYQQQAAPVAQQAPVYQPAVQAAPAQNVSLMQATPATPAQWQPATTPELGDPPHPIKNNRSLAAYILLSIITLGIYSYYFIYSIAKDMNTMCADDDQKTGGLLFFILLNIVTFGIYAVYWWYKVAERTWVNGPRYNAVITEKGSNYLMWWLIGLVTFTIGCWVGNYIVIKNVNTLATAYNSYNRFVYTG